MWQKYKFEENKIYTAQIGSTRLWVKKQDKIWLISSGKEEARIQSTKGFEVINQLPEYVSWNQYIADKHTGFQLIPALPDRPIVVKPEVPFTILSGMSLGILLKIPVWIQLYTSTLKPENLIFECATNGLSSTWFGDPTNGELSYELQSEIIQKLPESCSADVAICPITIRNDSQTTLDFHRLLIDVNQLNIYGNSKLLCTNEVKVRFKGEEQNTEVQIVHGNPELAGDLKQVGYARTKTDKNLLKKSFYFIKSFTQY